VLVCSVSLSRRRAAIAADVAEAAAALDAPGTGNVVFATLVDDPASVGEHVDAFLGQIMLEAANAAATVTAGLSYATAIAETAAAADVLSSSVPLAVAETATAASTQDATVVSGVVFPTWEAASVAAVTLSGGNLVATNTGTTSTSQGAHVAAASGKTSGKFYVEFTVTNYAGGAGVGFGIGTTPSIYSDMSTFSTHGNMIFVVGHNGAGPIWSDTNNSGLNLGRALATGDVIGVALDLTIRKAWFRISPSGLWNNVPGHDPTNPVSGGGFGVPAGTIVPFVTFGSSFSGAAGVSGNVITANFGASSFVGAVPSGYTAGWV
jgi:hypothetical protein